MASLNTQDIRNIALIGHGHSGKTLLAESMLHKAGVVTRLGTPDDGASTSDFDEEEKLRKTSIDASVLNISWKNRHLNIIDAPGYADFIGQVALGLSAVETAVLVINASAGIEIGARRFFDMAKARGLAVAIVVNKCDAENIDLLSLVDQLQESFGNQCKIVTAPVGQSHDFKGVINVLDKQDGDALVDLAQSHQDLVESIVEADESLMERFFADESISPEEIQATFAKAMAGGSLIPVFFTCARNETGTEELLEAMAAYFPSPVVGVKAKAVKGEGEAAQEIEIEADPAGKLLAKIFKITSDPFVGKLGFLRIYRGTLLTDGMARIGDERKDTRFAQLLRVQGKDHKPITEAVAGDIVATSKIEELAIGRTIWQGEELTLVKDEFPVPMYSLAVEPKSRGDEQKISSALSRFTEQDPALKAVRDRQTGELVISGLGDMHLNTVLSRMKRMFQVEVTTKPPKIPYHETISGKAEGHYRHKKQTGGAGQFGEVYLRIEPLERDTGFEFVNDIFGGSIPGQFLPAIEKGIRECLDDGVIAGYPFQDVRVSVYDGKYHPVDSKEIAFKIAGRNAFKDAVSKAKPVLLEPIVNLEIVIPSSFMGDITGDLNSRRGRIVGMDAAPGNMQVIKASAPLAEVATYNTQLRSITGGQGSYSMEFSHYEQVPGNVQKQIVDAYAAQKKDSED
ncbi:MAG: elongation factor G [Planctomycetes bacterium]|nr:elongation factor G [Planctomycetota bacterium]